MKQRKHIAELDGLRGIAALMVMFFHFFQGLGYTNDEFLNLIQKYAKFGQTGVSLFFVLSGFLITRILLNVKNESNYFKNFWGRRILRIFPLYYLFLIIFYFVSPIITGNEIASIDKQFYYWIYLQNFAETFHWPSHGPGHFWSLAVEEHFYLIWPFVVYYLNNKTIFRVSIGLIVLSCILRLYMFESGFEVFYFSFTRMDGLLMGAIIALMEVRDFEKFVEKRKYFAGAFLALSFVTLGLWKVFAEERSLIMQMFKFNLIEGAYFCLISYIVFSPVVNRPAREILNNAFLNFSGKISYGLYVFHPICFGITAYFIKGNIGFGLLVAFALSYIFSAASFYLFESQFLRFKRFFEYGTRNVKQTQPYPEKELV